MSEFPNFEVEVFGVLEQKGFKNKCYALDSLVQSVTDNEAIVSRKLKTYKPFGFILLTLIPLLSAILSALIEVRADIIPWLPDGGLLFSLSLMVTILSILNSMYKPSQRFHEACLIGIGIQRFATNFVADLESMPQLTEIALADFIRAKQAEFEQFQVALIELALPLEATSRKLSESSQGTRRSIRRNSRGPSPKGPTPEAA